jgi:hypothetical protein
VFLRADSIRTGIVLIQAFLAHSQVLFSQRLTAICLVFASRKSRQNCWIRRDLAQFGIFALYESDESCWRHRFEPQRGLRAGLVKFLAVGCGLNEFSPWANRRFRGSSKSRGLSLLFLRAGSEARTTGRANSLKLVGEQLSC